MPSFSQFLLDSNEQKRQEFRLRGKWMVRLRWLYIILLGVVAIASTYLAGGSMRQIQTYSLLGLAGLAINGLFWLAMAVRSQAKLQFYQVIAVLQVGLDLLLASAAIYSQGGINSRATLLYAVPILIAGILFRKPAAYIAATVGSLAYMAVIVLYPFVHAPTYPWEDLIVPLMFYPSLLMLLAAIITRFGALNAMDQRERTYEQLLAMLRHQLHHPSSVIAVVVEMLEYSKNYPSWPAKDKEYLRQLKRENLRLNTMITNVLESAATETDPKRLAFPTKVNLLELLNDTAISCAVGAKRLDDLKSNLPNEHFMLDAQPQQLRTALDNIIENAFHYSPKGTPVTIALSRDKKSGYITIKVSDKGPGMSDDQLKELLKLFTRLEEQAGEDNKQTNKLYSMGLGLYVSKVIIERHHGTMRIESKQDEGTTVIIKLQEEIWLRPEFYT